MKAKKLPSSWSQVICRVFSCVCVALMLSLPHVSANSAIRTVVLSGEVVSGAPTGTTFGSLNSPVLNSLGWTAFSAGLEGTGVNNSNNEAILSEAGGTGLELLSREGDSAPGVGNGVLLGGYYSTGSPLLNSSGQVALHHFALTGLGVDGTNNSGLWLHESNPELSFLVREGSQALGSGPDFGTLGPIKFNKLGQVAFRSPLTGTGVTADNDDSIWKYVNGTGPLLIAREGDVALDSGGDVLFGYLNSPALSGTGHISFSGGLVGSVVSSTNNIGIWSGIDSTSLRLVARAGDSAPGTIDDVNFNGLGSPVINDAGHTAFYSTLTGTDVDSSNNSGIWSEGEGTGLGLVAREGDGAPGTEVDFRLFNYPLINREGHVAFTARLIGPGTDATNNDGIWSEGGGNGLRLVAREGDAAPGANGSANFAFGGSLSISTSMNGPGQIAFSAYLSDPDIDSTNDRGIWAEDRSGGLVLIIREGDEFDVDDGPGIDLRTITSVSFVSNSGNEDGRSSGFNDSGQLAFRASFSDGSTGIFVSNAVAVPEPMTASLLASGLIAFTLVCRAARVRNTILTRIRADGTETLHGCRHEVPSNW